MDKFEIFKNELLATRKKAFALDCAVRWVESYQKFSVATGNATHVVDIAKIFEDYLGKEE